MWIKAHYIPIEHDVPGAIPLAVLRFEYAAEEVDRLVK
jgi:hypothetical protein